MGVTGAHTHPKPREGTPAARPEAPLVLPDPPMAPHQQWIVIGPRTRAQLAAQLERTMPLVWLVLLETHGVPEGQEFRLVLDAAHLEPVRPGSDGATRDGAAGPVGPLAHPAD